LLEDSSDRYESDPGLPELLNEQLGGLLEVLPDNYRQIIVLRYLEGRSLTQIALEFGLRVSTVYRWGDRAIGLLRDAARQRGYYCD
jgi:RNA polymerase sigma factor (sigma-70 family)